MSCYFLRILLMFFKHETFMVLSRDDGDSQIFKKYLEIDVLFHVWLLNSFITCIERDKLIDALYFENN